MEQGEYLGIPGSDCPLARKFVGCTEFSAILSALCHMQCLRGGFTWQSRTKHDFFNKLLIQILLTLPIHSDLRKLTPGFTRPWRPEGRLTTARRQLEERDSVPAGTWAVGDHREAAMEEVNLLLSWRRGSLQCAMLCPLSRLIFWMGLVYAQGVLCAYR